MRRALLLLFVIAANALRGGCGGRGGVSAAPAPAVVGAALSSYQRQMRAPRDVLDLGGPSAENKDYYKDLSYTDGRRQSSETNRGEGAENEIITTTETTFGEEDIVTDPIQTTLGEEDTATDPTHTALEVEDIATDPTHTTLEEEDTTTELTLITNGDDDTAADPTHTDDAETAASSELGDDHRDKTYVDNNWVTKSGSSILSTRCTAGKESAEIEKEDHENDLTDHSPAAGNEVDENQETTPTIQEKETTTTEETTTTRQRPSYDGPPDLSNFTESIFIDDN